MSLIKENFIVQSEKGQALYNIAKDIPIFDFHCHLDPKEIYENKPFNTITEVWLKHDHYKWRLMRAYGIDESYITGDKTDKEKFEAFISLLPKSIMNPIYHWCHLELARYFDINENLNKIDKDQLYNQLNESLQQPEFLPRKLIERSNVQIICTTDDPCDDLKYHQLLREDKSFDVKVLPTFRSDRYIALTKDNVEASINQLEIATETKINHVEEYINALNERIEYFHQNGARSSDQSFAKVLKVDVTKDQAEQYFEQIKHGEDLDEEDLSRLSGYILTEVSKTYKKYNWVVQFHLGPVRNNNTLLFEEVGPDAGFDSVGDMLSSSDLNRFLDHLNQNDALSDTIIYPNNANDHLMVQATAGNFTSDKVKVQLGAAWWFNDTKEGMEQHLVEYANVGLLSTFVGMLTDSRSLLSYTRHEYFRRILCEMIGKRVERGEIIDDDEILSEIIKDICFNNAVSLYNIEGIDTI